MIVPVLKELIIDGRIPYFMRLKQILLWLAVVTPFYIFIVPDQFTDFAELGWNSLVFVMLIRPLADIFPNIKILRTLSMLRKEFGVFAGMLILAHFVGFIITQNVNVFSFLFNPINWSLKTYFGWGLFGLLFGLSVLLSSNKFAMKLLGKWWRRVQKLAYLFFFFGGIHIVLGGEGSGLFGLIVVAVAWLLARFRFVVRIP